METGGSVDIRHSNFIGNETFDEEFDTFADVYSVDSVTLPNNYWSGSVGESVSENVSRSPQSPTRILYGSFSSEGEPCYVPPPPTLCPASSSQTQAFGATREEVLGILTIPNCIVDNWWEYHAQKKPKNPTSSVAACPSGMGG
ncbi:MAG: hypothetical protein K8I82_04510 [Anaerolineae bacterium]|nr:hypothetical protein [Anaerolineae bacterium]